MGWQEDIKAYPLVKITTGDGETYDALIKFKGGSIDPKTATYNYAGKIGSKPTRNSSSSPIYDLTLYIHQDLWKSFKNSVSDPSDQWLIKHPLYGDLKGHPTSINWDNVKFGGDVEWNVQFQESIIDDTPSVSVDYKGRVLARNIFIGEILVVAFADKTPSVEEKGLLTKFVDDLEKLYESVLNSDYLNAFYDIRQVLQDTVFDAARFISLTDQILNIGSTLSLDGILYPLKTRLDLMINQNTVILSTDINVDTTTPDGNTSDLMAIFKELSGASNLSALSVAISTPSESQNDVSGFDVTDQQNAGNTPDYRYKKDVDSTIQTANEELNNYIISLDSIDIETQGFIKYSPDNDLNAEVDNIINLSIQEIKEISKNAKEEKIFTTDQDTIPEILAFRLLGSASESNVNEIIDNNDLLGKNSIENSWRNFVIKKNTQIIYYD